MSGFVRELWHNWRPRCNWYKTGLQSYCVTSYLRVMWIRCGITDGHDVIAIRLVRLGFRVTVTLATSGGGRDLSEMTTQKSEKKGTFERKKNNPKERNLKNQMDIWAKKKEDIWTKCYILVPFPLARLMSVAPWSPWGGESRILTYNNRMSWTFLCSWTEFSHGKETFFATSKNDYLP